MGARAAQLVVLVALVAALLVPGAARAAAPQLTAPSAVLVEPATRDVVVARKATQRRPIASTTKLMTALLALERLPLDGHIVAAPYAPGPAESVLGQRAGERFTVRDELRALLLVSANDAAVTFAVRIGGTQKRFVAMMNARARELGLTRTHFATPVGLDVAGNYSTAEDLVKLALVLRAKPFFRQTTNLARTTLRSGDRPRTIVNRNTLVREIGFVNGVKTGHTSRAGYVLVGSAGRDGISVLSAVLGEPSEASRDRDSLNLLRYGLQQYRIVTAVKKGREFGSVALEDRDERVALVAERTVRRTARRGERLTTRVVGRPAQLTGPVSRGTRVATLEVRQRGRTVARIGLVTQRAVAAATTVEKLDDEVPRGPLLVLAVLLAGSLGLVLLRRRAVRRRRRGPVGSTEAA